MLFFLISLYFLFSFLFNYFSFFVLSFCFSDLTTHFFKKKKIWKNLSFCFAHFHTKRTGCFSKQTKVKTHFLRRSEKSKNEHDKDDERTIFEIFLKNQEEIQKNKFGDIRKGFLFREKYFFVRTRLKRTQSRHTFWSINVTRSKCVQEKEVSEAKVTMVPFFEYL